MSMKLLESFGKGFNNKKHQKLEKVWFFFNKINNISERSGSLVNIGGFF